MRRISIPTPMPPSLPDMSKLNEIRENVEMAKAGMASVLHDRLMNQIQDFEKDLESNEEIGAYLSSFGTTFLIQIETVKFHNPFFIIFDGYTIDTKQKVRLVQHTTQLNVLFTSIKLNPEEKREA
jgi:hypothetical protein